jgi:hypothetical protein
LQRQKLQIQYIENIKKTEFDDVFRTNYENTGATKSNEQTSTLTIYGTHFEMGKKPAYTKLTDSMAQKKNLLKKLKLA